MRVLAVSSVGGACGIWNYCQMLQEAVEAADPAIKLFPSAEALDPAWGIPNAALYDLVWLNYHRGLHSRWTPAIVQAYKAQGYPVVITMHDTYGERPPDPLAQALHDLVDAFVVHEPCEGLPKQILIRQGVPAMQVPRRLAWLYSSTERPEGQVDPEWMRVPHHMPVLGTCGFNFPWKNFDRLAEVTAACGWAYLVLSNNATDADAARWIGANPWTCVVRGFRPTSELVAWLGGCDATCFAYECANSGTSGAIRLGLAARKPVLAFNATRQFRDLYGDREITDTIRWCDFKTLPYNLRTIPIQRVDPGIAYLAHRDSWAAQGRRYAEVFKLCVTSR